MAPVQSTSKASDHPLSHHPVNTMNIDSASLTKRNRLAVTLTLSGAELSWLQHLAQVELDKDETLAWAYGSDMIMARELRSMTERLDPHYIEACALAKREGWNMDVDQILALVKKAKQQQAIA